MWDGFIPFFGTDDLEATHQFYHGVLGLRLYKDQGLCRIYEVKDGAWIGFCNHHPTVPAEVSPLITLLTDDVDKAYDQLVADGIRPEGRPKRNQRFNIYHFFVSDPNGYKVEIQKFLD